MRFNFSFLAQFMGGLYAIYVASVILREGRAGGFFFPSWGTEARIHGALMACVGVYLTTLPFIKQRPVRWADIFWMAALLFSTEIVPHFAIFAIGK